MRLLVAVSEEDDLAELTGGMSLHVWLQHQARCTRGEAREVLGAVDVLRVMPATLAGLADRWLSWSQTAAISKAARRVPVARRGQLDGLVASAMVAHRDRFVTLEPRLFGGGSMYGEWPDGVRHPGRGPRRPTGRPAAARTDVRHGLQ